MAKYEVRIKRSAVKEIEALPRKDRQRVVRRINALGEDPRPRGCEKFSTHERYKLRQGNYRILYEIADKVLLVVVVKVGDRKSVYR